MNLNEILENKIKFIIEKSKENQINALSGSNALLFDGYNFEAESSDNCPRVALLRRFGGIQEEKSIKSYISNTHGRTFEDFFRDVLKINNDDNNILEFMEEEQVQVKIEDDQGNVLLTARPDKIVKFKDILYPIEIKTIQSNSTAYQIFIKEKPKFGALLQLAIYMYGHKLEKGFLLYCASNWFSGFAGKGKQWKVEPSFKIFDVEINKDGFIYYNDIKTVINFDKIIQGSYQFLNYKNTNKIPNRPVWINSVGDPAQYDGCTYCFARETCEFVDENRIESLTEFFNKQEGLSEDII